MDCEDDFKLYQALSSLRSSGTRDYHSMCSTYLIANTIILTLSTLILELSSEKSKTTIITSLSILGIFICIQMGLALSRLRRINNLIEENLRIIESENPEWIIKFYTKMSKYIMNPDSRLQISKTPPGMGIEYGNTRWGGRMKTFPFLFGLIYSVLFIFTIRPTVCFFLASLFPYS